MLGPGGELRGHVVPLPRVLRAHDMAPAVLGLGWRVERHVVPLPRVLRAHDMAPVVLGLGGGLERHVVPLPRVVVGPSEDWMEMDDVHAGCLGTLAASGDSYN